MRRTLAFVIALVGAPGVSHAQNNTSWGVGYGIPYGNIGVNVQYRAVEDFYAVGAIGTGVNFLGYAIGGTYFLPLNYFKTAQLHATLLYGTYGGLSFGHVDANGNEVNKEGTDFASIALGVGATWFSGDEGFDFGLYLINNSAVRDRARQLRDDGYIIYIKGGDTLSPSIGYRHRF